MIFWETNKKMPIELHDRLIEYINMQDKFITTYKNEKWFLNIDGFLDFYDELIKEMMLGLGMWTRSKYEFEIWCQCYNNKTQGHEPHEHFSGKEIISFNHIITPTKKKCFYFINDYGNKIYPDKQDSGHFFAWSPWIIHGSDPVEEDNVNRLIVAGNLVLTDYYAK